MYMYISVSDLSSSVPVDVSEGTAEDVVTLKEHLLAVHEEEMTQMQDALKQQQQAVLQTIREEFERNQVRPHWLNRYKLLCAHMM